MIIIPEIQTVVILVPRTASRSLKLAVRETYPRSMQLYRHMEADGVPQGYDRWPRIGVVRNPIDRLWSLYKYIQVMGGRQDGFGKWEPAYVEAQRRSVDLPFSYWVTENQTVFTGPYDSAGRGRFWPSFAVRHHLPETRKSQFIYLRPDLGTRVVRFDQLHELEEALKIKLGHEHRTEGDCPGLSAAATDHMARFFDWDFSACGMEAHRSAAA